MVLPFFSGPFCLLTISSKDDVRYIKSPFFPFPLPIPFSTSLRNSRLSAWKSFFQRWFIWIITYWSCPLFSPFIVIKTVPFPYPPPRPPPSLEPPLVFLDDPVLSCEQVALLSPRLPQLRQPEEAFPWFNVFFVTAAFYPRTPSLLRK